jgi:hypothetical protein
MTNLLRDLGFGFRLLRKNLGFASVAILALALGIGANTAIFSVVYATLLAPLPYPHPEQLVIVWSKVAGDRNVVAAGDFLDWQRENSVFQAMAVLNGSNFNLATGNRPEQTRPPVSSTKWAVKSHCWAATLNLKTRCQAKIMSWFSPTRCGVSASAAILT